TGYDVDHEVIAPLNRFKASQNLVINTIVAWTARTDRVVGNRAVFVVPWWHSRGVVPRVDGTRAEKTQVTALIILSCSDNACALRRGVRDTGRMDGEHCRRPEGGADGRSRYLVQHPRRAGRPVRGCEPAVAAPRG